MTPYIKMYTKSDCPLCEKAKALFAQYPHIKVDEIKLEDQGLRDRIYNRFARAGADRLMPQIILYVDGDEHYIGGWKELQGEGIESLFQLAAAIEHLLD